MSSISDRFSRMDRYEGVTRRGHRDSDATLIDYPAAEGIQTSCNIPGYHYNEDDFRQEYDYGYDQPEYLYYDNEPYEMRSSYSRDDYTRNQDMDSLHHYAYLYDNDRPNYLNQQRSDLRRDSQQKRRSVRFDIDNEQGHYLPSDSLSSRNVQRSTPYLRSYPRATQNEMGHEDYDDYGYIQDEHDHAGQYSTAANGQSLDYKSAYDDDRLAGLPQPATASQKSTSSVAHGYLPSTFSKAGGKVSLTKRIKQAFITMSANPDEAALGCKPGRPTPQHILDKEAEEETIEEEKRHGERLQREDRVRQSMLRRESTFRARIAEECERLLQSQIQPRGAQHGANYDARIAEEYARELARLHEYDAVKNHRRESRDSGRDTRYHYPDQFNDVAQPI